MAIINLREYYPYFLADTFIEVSDEVASLIRQSKLDENAHRLRTYRHKAYFSLDLGDDIECESVMYVLTPPEILERKEDRTALCKALARLSQTQRSRVLAYYVFGIKQVDIARAEHTSPSNVNQSISRGIRHLKKFLKKF